MHLQKSTRFTIGTRIDDSFLEIIELLLEAGYAKKELKTEIIQKAISKLDYLKFFLKILWELGAIDNKKYALLSAPLLEIGKMLGGWINFLKNNSRI